MRRAPSSPRSASRARPSSTAISTTTPGRWSSRPRRSPSRIPRKGSPPPSERSSRSLTTTRRSTSRPACTTARSQTWRTAVESRRESRRRPPHHLLDSMHDQQTGAASRSARSNVQKDAILYNDTWQDSSWDAEGQSAGQRRRGGLDRRDRIPLRSCGLPGDRHQTWGINVSVSCAARTRALGSRWCRRTRRVWPTRHGRSLRPRRLKPAAISNCCRTPAGAPNSSSHPQLGRPFNDGSRAFASARSGPEVGRDQQPHRQRTVNPDFGQVEVDPAVVNLTAFETFFPEKRRSSSKARRFSATSVRAAPTTPGASTTPSPTFSTPAGSAVRRRCPGDFTDVPSATTILGAAKLTGKTRNWSLGLLKAVTDREQTARTESQDIRCVKGYGICPVSSYWNNAVWDINHRVGERRRRLCL